MTHLAFCLFTGMAASAAPEIIAHRGASFEAPENTLASVKLGWQQTDTCEIDIHLSKDGQVIVMHDSSTNRTTGANGDIATQTLADLKQLDASSWKGDSWRGEKIPTLSEVLAALPPQKKLIIEIKAGPEILPALEASIKAASADPTQLFLISFDHATLQLAKAHLPQIPAFSLFSYEKDPVTGKFPRIGDLISKAKAAGFNGLNLNYRFPIDSAFAAQVKAAGLKLYVWTVDDSAMARKLAEAGVDGITTNRPGWLRERLVKATAKP